MTHLALAVTHMFHTRACQVRRSEKENVRPMSPARLSAPPSNGATDAPQAEQYAIGAGHDIVLYGFGRIGRLAARLLIEKTGSGQKLRLRAIVVRQPKVPDLEKRGELLIRDSVGVDDGC